MAGTFDFLGLNNGENWAPENFSPMSLPSEMKVPDEGSGDSVNNSGSKYGMFGKQLWGNPNFAQLLMQIGAGMSGKGTPGAAIGNAGSNMVRQIQMQQALKGLTTPTAPNLPGPNSHTVKIGPDKISTTTEMPMSEENLFGGQQSPEMGQARPSNFSAGGTGDLKPSVDPYASGGASIPFFLNALR